MPVTKEPSHCIRRVHATADSIGDNLSPTTRKIIRIFSHVILLALAAVARRSVVIIGVRCFFFSTEKEIPSSAPVLIRRENRPCGESGSRIRRRQEKCAEQ
ncbi:unnamed protein product [Arabis nemorensis]|uniref:Uncharacterized protein n=1 Tax=Arabis nemorensis TaxID=586526 RepID=A0A565CUS7_9BRAS|nr:unnamed protein product [Arabis nemorensis]